MSELAVVDASGLLAGAPRDVERVEQELESEARDKAFFEREHARAVSEVEALRR